MYNTRGFSVLQNLAANIVLKLESKNMDASIDALNMPFGHDETYEDLITDLMSIILPYLILLAFLPPVYNTVFHIVREKESRIKETMLIMGMKRFSYWLSWYVSYTIVSTLIALLAWSMLLINVINHSNEFLVLLMIFCYA